MNEHPVSVCKYHFTMFLGHKRKVTDVDFICVTILLSVAVVVQECEDDVDDVVAHLGPGHPARDLPEVGLVHPGPLHV